jgi:hypothetical protein
MDKRKYQAPKQDYDFNNDELEVAIDEAELGKIVVKDGSDQEFSGMSSDDIEGDYGDEEGEEEREEDASDQEQEEIEEDLEEDLEEGN